MRRLWQAMGATNPHVNLVVSLLCFASMFAGKALGAVLICVGAALLNWNLARAYSRIRDGAR